MKRAAGVNVKNKTGYLSKDMIRQKLSDDDITMIKDAFYRTIDGLIKLVEILENTDLCSEHKNAQEGLKIMEKSKLEHLWMKF